MSARTRIVYFSFVLCVPEVHNIFYQLYPPACYVVQSRLSVTEYINDVGPI